ncbi:MAG: SAM-dependent methyltransferase, partial [Acidobacteriota bacterium]
MPETIGTKWPRNESADGVALPRSAIADCEKARRTQYTDGVCAESGTLWIVATPIGSLGDLSPRARDVLEEVDLILSEDTRRTRRLLSHLGLNARGRLRSLHEHNEKQKVPSLLEELRAGV